MVTGDAVNVAARLRGAAEPGGSWPPSAPPRGAGASGSRRSARSTSRARRAPVAMELLEGGAAIQDRGVPGLHAPMVGRDEELAVADDVPSIASAEEAGRTSSRSTAMPASGRAGSPRSSCGGRSECRHRDRAGALPSVRRRHHLLAARGDPQGSRRRPGLGPAGARAREDPHGGRELLTEDVASDPARATAALAFTVGRRRSRVRLRVDGASRGARRRSTPAGGRSSPRSRPSGPLVVIVEDIHWADPALLDLLDELVERVVGPVLFVCPSRPDLAARRPAWGGGRRNPSRSSARSARRRSKRTGSSTCCSRSTTCPPSVHARILERAEGNPFFLEEIVRQLIDEGHLVREGERLARAGRDRGRRRSPTRCRPCSRRASTSSSPEDKRVLQAAAVVGRVFWPGAGGAARTPGRRSVDEHRSAGSRIAELVLVAAGSSHGRTAGVHLQARADPRRRLRVPPRRDRADAHAAVAGWIEETAGERAREIAELLAYHSSTAVALSQRPRRRGPSDDLRAAAFRWSLRASDEARRRLVVRKARRLAEEALDLASGDLERTDALEMLARAFFADYSGDLAWRYYREAALTRARAEPPDEETRGASRCARLRRGGSMAGIPPRRRAGRRDRRANCWSSGSRICRHGRHGGADPAPGIRALWPFAFAPEGYSEAELEELETAGLQAAEMALRMGLPNRASAAFDQATGPWVRPVVTAGSIRIWEMRSEVMARSDGHARDRRLLRGGRLGAFRGRPLRRGT